MDVKGVLTREAVEAVAQRAAAETGEAIAQKAATEAAEKATQAATEKLAAEAAEKIAKKAAADAVADAVTKKIAAEAAELAADTAAEKALQAGAAKAVNRIRVCIGDIIFRGFIRIPLGGVLHDRPLEMVFEEIQIIRIVHVPFTDSRAERKMLTRLDNLNVDVGNRRAGTDCGNTKISFSDLFNSVIGFS